MRRWKSQIVPALRGFEGGSSGDSCMLLSASPHLRDRLWTLPCCQLLRVILAGSSLEVENPWRTCVVITAFVGQKPETTSFLGNAKLKTLAQNWTRQFAIAVEIVEMLEQTGEEKLPRKIWRISSTLSSIKRKVDRQKTASNRTT